MTRYGKTSRRLRRRPPPALRHPRVTRIMSVAARRGGGDHRTVQRAIRSGRLP